MGRLNKALRENKIKLNGKKQPLSTRVQNGDIIKLFLNDDQLENRPTPAAVFVYEDDDIIIASKPAGIAVDGPDSDTLLAACKRSWPLRARLPTRCSATGWTPVQAGWCCWRRTVRRRRF